MDLAQDGPWLTLLDIGPSRLGSTWAQVDLALHGFVADLTCALAHSTQFGPGFTRLDFGLGILCSTFS